MSFQVGIVGVGSVAQSHASACLRDSQVRLAAICDLSEEALQAFGEQFGVSRRYTDLEAMLRNESLDIVIVATWGPSHAAVSKAVAGSGKVRGILCEKPISMNSAECEEMVGVARQHHVLLTEGFKWRHDPQHIRTKEIIDSGCIGKVMSIQSTLSSPLVRLAPASNWRFDRLRGGGSVFDTASYLIDYARYMLGAEPNRVFAVGSFREACEVELSASILLEFGGGVTAKLTSSYEYGYCQATAILGTRGWIRVDMPFDLRSVRDQEFVEKEELPATVHVFYDNFDSEDYRFAPANQFSLQLRHLCDCLESGHPHRHPAESSLGNMRVLDAVHQSIRTGKAVDIAKPA